jgi:adenylosuccinate synthase
MGLDRLDYANRGVSDYDLLTLSAKEFIAFVENNTGVCVRIVGTGFTTHEAIRIPMRKESPALAHI